MKKKIALVARYRIVCGSTTINFLVVYYECSPSMTLTYRSDIDAENYIKSLGLEENSYLCREFLINEDETACEFKFSMDI